MSPITLDADALRTIHKALLIGLTCYGEIEERSNAQEVADVVGKPCTEGARILHPTGTADVVSTFASALCYVSRAAE